MSFAVISSGFMLLFQGLVTCWNFTQVNMSMTPNITRVTILSAFISSPGPTVQIISDIRKSFSWKSNNLIHSDALLVEKKILIIVILYFSMGICESRKSCLTQLAYWFVLPKLLLPGQTLKKKSNYLRVKCWMQLMSTIFARNRMLAGLSEGLWRKSHKSLKTTAILKIPTIHQVRHNRVLSEANAAFCAKRETKANNPRQIHGLNFKLLI